MIFDSLIAVRLWVWLFSICHCSKPIISANIHLLGLKGRGGHLIARILLRSLHLTTRQITAGGKDFFDYADGFGCVTLGTCDEVADEM